MPLAEKPLTFPAENLANVFTVRQSHIDAYVGTLGPEKMARVCEALSIAMGCD